VNTEDHQKEPKKRGHLGSEGNIRKRNLGSTVPKAVKELRKIHDNLERKNPLRTIYKSRQTVE
jgi:hypothetical protein